MIVRHSDVEKRRSWEMVRFSRATFISPQTRRWQMDVSLELAMWKWRKQGRKKKSEEREERLEEVTNNEGKYWKEDWELLKRERGVRDK